ncbi:hypothetical protein HNQ69_000990 [Bartonella callosciuri]|uniref:Uncharacterized protein n=1 Tax=Bartonella callosciuri TaxID=686223 RepID=A0A840NQR7_9HYPH|nr:hypothetical protein [Bartonella callosciuri]MBB5073864.1 hypothetical protein [Bartonella callosciuri]
MQSLKPEMVIPGHYIKNDTSPALLDFVKTSLTDYKNAAISHKDSSSIISDMEKKYPDFLVNNLLNLEQKFLPVKLLGI